MKKLSLLLIIPLLFFFNYCKGQSQQQVDSMNKVQVEYGKFVDSLSEHTTIKQLMDYLDGKVTSKFMREGTLNELYAYFIQNQYQLWMQNKNKPKKK